MSKGVVAFRLELREHLRPGGSVESMTLTFSDRFATSEEAKDRAEMINEKFRTVSEKLEVDVRVAGPVKHAAFCVLA
jgi:hypothetical protein